jgi:hypothetical protein
MKALTYALLITLFSFAAVGTVGAQTFGTPTQVNTCGPGCLVYQNTETYTVMSNWASTELNAAEVSLPQFNIGGATLTNVTYDVDGYVGGQITLTNNTGSAESLQGSVYSNIIAFENQSLAANGPSNAYSGYVGYALTGTYLTPAFLSVPADTDETFPTTPGANTTTINSVLSYEEGSTPVSENTSQTGTCITGTYGTQMSCYVGGGDFNFWIDTQTSQTATGGNGSFNTYAQVGGQVEYTYDYDVSGIPEPVSMTLLGSGLACLGLLKRKRLTR